MSEGLPFLAEVPLEVRAPGAQDINRLGHSSIQPELNRELASEQRLNNRVVGLWSGRISVYCRVWHLTMMELLALRGVAPRRAAQRPLRTAPFRPLYADGLVAARQAPPARNRDAPLWSRAANRS